MRTVEKYQSLSEHLLNDQYVRKYGLMIVRHGFKGAAKKINPTALYVDAAISVITACNSYINYAKQREITRQIEIENQQIKQELQCQLDALKIEHKIWKMESSSRLKLLKQITEKQKVQTSNLIIEINRVLALAKAMQQHVRSERENGMAFEQLCRLQTSLDTLIHTCIAITTNSIE